MECIHRQGSHRRGRAHKQVLAVKANYDCRRILSKKIVSTPQSPHLVKANKYDFR